MRWLIDVVSHEWSLIGTERHTSNRVLTFSFLPPCSLYIMYDSLDWKQQYNLSQWMEIPMNARITK